MKSIVISSDVCLPIKYVCQTNLSDIKFFVYIRITPPHLATIIFVASKHEVLLLFYFYNIGIIDS